VTIEVSVEDDGDVVMLAADSFVGDCRAANLAAEKVESAPRLGPVVRAASPASTIVVHIDPGSIRSLFEYAAALIAIHKGDRLIGAFLKAGTEKLGATAGEELGRAITHLWKAVVTKIKSSDRARAYLSLETDMDGTSFAATALLSAEKFAKLSDEQMVDIRERAIADLLLFVIPVAFRIVKEARQFNREIARIEAVLLDGNDAHDMGHWRLRLDQIGSFVIDSDGSLSGELGHFESDDISDLMAKVL
jgi:hypothetical protein